MRSKLGRGFDSVYHMKMSIRMAVSKCRTREDLATLKDAIHKFASEEIKRKEDELDKGKEGYEMINISKQEE